MRISRIVSGLKGVVDMTLTAVIYAPFLAVMFLDGAYYNYSKQRGKISGMIHPINRGCKRRIESELGPEQIVSLEGRKFLAIKQNKDEEPTILGELVQRGRVYIAGYRSDSSEDSPFPFTIPGRTLTYWDYRPT